MNITTFFIKRPVAATLLACGIALAGLSAFNLLPVSSLPAIDFPTISVQASLPGASPEIMATSVATPLERQFGRIAGITQMTSSSVLGSTNITIQFDLNRNIDGAARDVQAAIYAAAAYLPPNLPNNPTYRKVNPADAPILIMALTSTIFTTGQLYGAASNILAQKLSQVNGVGQVVIGGSSLPGVRVELNPTALNKYRISLEDVKTAIAAANVNLPKGQISFNGNNAEIYTNDQLFAAKEYRPLIIAYHNNQPVRLSDVGQVVDSIENIRTAGLADDKPAVLLVIFRQPGANVIKTVNNIQQAMPFLKAVIPTAMNMTVMMDRTTTIKASLRDVELTLIIAVILVILVVYIFLGNWRAAAIPSVAVPLSLLGTFGVMYVLGYSLDNLSLMALTISTGFVVDDAVVVLENVTRHIESGMAPVAAAIQGAKEVSFTVISMSLSLIAVFLPILLMGGLVGRLFHEFAVTLSVAILMSLIISLTVTPVMCAELLRNGAPPIKKHQKNGYEKSLAWALANTTLMFLLTIAAIILSILLFIMVPKGFFPQQDTGRISGSIQADQNISFRAMQQKLDDFARIIQGDQAVKHVVAFTGSTGTTTNSGLVFITLKDLAKRHHLSVDEVINRLRPKLAVVSGATLYLQAAQDLVIGGRLGNAEFQYTLWTDQLKEINNWGPKVMQRISQLHGITDVNSDQFSHGLQSFVTYDRDTASRFGISSEMMDNILYDAFGQNQISIIYTPLTQYHVVMEVAPPFWQRPESLNDIYVPSSTNTPVPLSAIAHFASSTTLLAVNHQNQFPAVTISFNLLPGIALGDVVARVTRAVDEMHLPINIQSTFQGTAQAFQASLSSEPYLIFAALLTVYIVLGILYESLIHPLTILSTLPAAGCGALLALLVTGTDLSVVALIGIILLIGIVKKNAIMMIDFALDEQRNKQLSPKDAIYGAALKRFRPIMMTTLAALFGALPLVLGIGIGSELRRPLGIAIVGGLIVSQMLTLYTTPVIYLLLDRTSQWWKNARNSHVEA